MKTQEWEESILYINHPFTDLKYHKVKILMVYSIMQCGGGGCEGRGVHISKTQRTITEES